jgi:secondary thiamine-phosphate synthase enzyme
MIHEFSISSHSREEMIDITPHIQRVVTDSHIQSGMAFCFIPHTTAGITINENADPDVKGDILSKLARVFPQQDHYRHAEGNSDAHIKASLMGSSQQILFENGVLVLGHWQAVFFCEFDGPRVRRVIIKVIPHA